MLRKMKVTDEFRGLVEEFNDVFLEELPDELPLERDLDFETKTKSDQQPSLRPVIRLSQAELQEWKKQLQLLLNKKLI